MSSFLPPSVQSFPSQWVSPPTHTSHHYTEPGEGEFQHLGIGWPAVGTGQEDLNSDVRGFSGMIRGLSLQSTLSLTCTTSLAPAASAKVTPLQSRTTTLMGSATRVGRREEYSDASMDHAQISFFVIPSHLHQVGHLALESPVSKEGQSVGTREDTNMNACTLSTRVPLGTPTHLPLPEKPLSLTLPCPSLQVPDATLGCGGTAHGFQSRVVLDSSGCRAPGPGGTKKSEGQRNIWVESSLPSLTVPHPPCGSL